jgi:hypothetical protein
MSSMMLITTLPAHILIPFLSNRFQIPIQLQKTENGYLMNHQIHDTVIYYHDIPILIQPLSKL